MATPVELPKSGNTVEECLIGRWVKREGDVVAAGDVVAEVETDKATFEIIAPVGGTMLATFFGAGALVPVFTTVCVIGAAGEDIEAFRPRPGGIRESGVGIRKEPDRIPTPDRIPNPRSRIPNPDSRVPTPSALSPRARRFAAERNLSLPSIVGSGPGGRVLSTDVRQRKTPRKSRRRSRARGALEPSSRAGCESHWRRRHGPRCTPPPAPQDCFRCARRSRRPRAPGACQISRSTRWSPSAPFEPCWKRRILTPSSSTARSSDTRRCTWDLRATRRAACWSRSFTMRTRCRSASSHGA